MIKTFSKIIDTDKYSQHSSIIWIVLLNDWVFVYELSGWGFESRCCHLNFWYCPSCEKAVPWHSGSYGIWIHRKKRTWQDKNIQLIAPYRKVLTTQLNHSASLAKYLSVPLQTKWLRVHVPLLSLKFEISWLFGVRISLIFRQLWGVDSLWKAYLT